MESGKPPRLLGRGIPPSQPGPPYLARSEPPGIRGYHAVHIVAAVIGLLVVVVLAGLLWRTRYAPKPKTTQPVMSAFVQTAASADPVDLALAQGNLLFKTDELTIDRVWIDACQRPGPGRTPKDQCDRQPYFERALVKAVINSGNCVPETPKDASISYALEVNHRTRSTRLFPGKSGTLRATEAKSTVACVARSLPEPDWENIPHEHTRYIIGVLATYPAQRRQ